MESSVDNLIFLLKYLEDTFENYENIVQSSSEYETYLNTNYPAIKDILSEADKHLITNQGTPNLNNIRILREHGFDVGPGERDSFGWLTGIIYTSKGMIVFG